MLVTADHKFASKIVDGYPGANVRYIGADHFADEIGAATGEEEEEIDIDAVQLEIDRL
ncbi:MAG: hypothetical protein OXS28_04560 [Gammaproteobacteria bacterium]|nr:hypothetical protein [Gammaproteobacteria bacterium]MDE0284552.1 hypothetical protein [Gammaproteobacteria bacterium]